ncbi:CHAP domain-containing protein [Solibacillus silvestris]
MVFNARTSSPSTSNKYYIHTSGGGYNKCIKIKGYDCLPNCVGYAYGRYMEAAGKTACSLPRSNAEDWIASAKSKGFETGDVPKLGAVLCFRKGKVKNSSDGCGHVLIVEKINYNDAGKITSILCSQSGYKSKRFWTSTIKPPYKLSGYVFQGFIYNPDVITPAPKAIYSGTFPKLPLKGYIKKGDKGTQVANLQKFLNWYGDYGLVVDNIFGTLTLEAVKKYQKAEGLSTDGIFGKKSLAKAKQIKKEVK